jgi:uncharacterized protein (TIGR01777 family)
MRVLLTGATGFVGRALTQRLYGEGHEVIGVSRVAEKARDFPGLSGAVGWDGLDEVFQRPVDVVIHLAGETVQGRWNKAKIQAVRESRLTTTAALVDAIVRAPKPPKVLLSASGIGYYGEGGETKLNESAAAGDDYFAEVCVKWEAEATRARACGCRVVLLRFGIIIGPGGGALDVMLTPAKWGVSGALGGGEQWWSWISLSDVVAAILHGVVTPQIDGPVNMVAPEPIRQRDFNRILCRLLRRPSWVPAPAFALRVVLGRFADEVLASKRVVPQALAETGFEWTIPDVEAALREALR